MDLASILYLGVTFGLFAVFVLIVIRTYSKKRREQGEIAKYRMLEDELIRFERFTPEALLECAGFMPEGHKFILIRHAPYKLLLRRLIPQRG